MKQRLLSAGKIIASVKMTIYLVGMLAVYIFVLAVLSSGELMDDGPLTYVNRSISEGITGRVLYILFLLNLFILIFKQVLIFIRQFSNGVIPVSPAELAKLPDHIVLDAERIPTGFFERLQQALKKEGFHVKIVPDKGIYAIKGRLSALGKLTLALSLFLLLLGLFISFNFRVAHNITAGEGQDIYLAEQAGVSRYSWTGGRREIKAQKTGALSDISFHLNRVDNGMESGAPRPWYSFLAGHVTAWISYPADTLENEAKIGFYPPKRLMGEYFQLTNFGYAPFAVIKDEQGQIMDQAFVILKLLPAGTEDFFQPTGLPYKFHISLAKSGEGMEISREPVYVLKIIRGKKLIYRGKAAPGQEITFEGKTISFPETRYWVEFNVISDAGIPVSLTGVILGVIGLGLTVFCKFIWYRRELFVISAEEATVQKIYAGARAERAHKSHTMQFQRLLEEIVCSLQN